MSGYWCTGRRDEEEVVVVEEMALKEVELAERI
jgi:hypothetical protein